MSVLLFLQVIAAAALAWLAMAVIRSDISEQKVRNRHLAAASFACLAVYCLQATLTAAGARGVVHDWLLGRFYLSSVRHELISLAAGVALWLLDVWPAGDAKLFVVCAAFLPLIQPNLRAFPNYLFLQLLTNIFVVAALFLTARSLSDALGVFWRAPTACIGRSLNGARAWIASSAEQAPRWSTWLPAMATTTALFLFFGVLRLEASRHATSLAIQPALLGAVLMLVWDRAGGWLRSVRVGAGAAILATAVFGLVAWRDPARSWDLLRATLFQVTVFSLILMAARSALERHLLSRAAGRIGHDDLRPGMILSDETVSLMSRDRGFFQEHLTPLRRDGLTLDQAAKAREWFLGLPPEQRTITVLRGYPFAAWIFAGTLFTLLMTRDAASLLLSLRPDQPGLTSVQKQAKYLFEDIRAPFFALDRRTGYYYPQRPGAAASRFSAVKSPGGFRVFVVGGSVARRYMELDPLGPILTQAMPGRRVEVISCGMPAYDSSREAMLFEEIRHYSPDLIVLFSGHNEFLDHMPPAPPFWRLPDVLRYRRQRLSRVQESYPEKVARREADFRVNLQGMLHQMGTMKVPVAVVLPPLNYRDSLAPHPEVRSAPEDGPQFYAGWARYLRGEYQSAVDEWREESISAETGSQPIRRAQALFFLSRALEKLGRSAEANRAAADSVDADLLAMRNSPRRLGVMRQIALKEGALVIDTDRVFRDIAKPRLPGLEMFTDALHWRHRYDPDISSAILRELISARLVKRLGSSRQNPRSIGAMPHSSQEIETDAEEALSTLRYAVSYLDKPDSQPSWPAILYLSFVYERYPAWFDDVPSLARRAEAGADGLGQAWGMPALHASLPQLYWHVAQMQLLQGRYRAAIAGFRRALELGPDQSRALLGLGIASALAGDAPGAREALEGAKSRGLALQASAIEKALGGLL